MKNGENKMLNDEDDAVVEKKEKKGKKKTSIITTELKEKESKNNLQMKSKSNRNSTTGAGGDSNRSINSSSSSSNSNSSIHATFESRLIVLNSSVILARVVEPDKQWLIVKRYPFDGTFSACNNSSDNDSNNDTTVGAGNTTGGSTNSAVLTLTWINEHSSSSTPVQVTFPTCERCVEVCEAIEDNMDHSFAADHYSGMSNQVRGNSIVRRNHNMLNTGQPYFFTDESLVGKKRTSMEGGVLESLGEIENEAEEEEEVMTIEQEERRPGSDSKRTSNLSTDMNREDHITAEAEGFALLATLHRKISSLK